VGPGVPPHDRRRADESLSGYSVYDGWEVQGWPRFVIRRGQVVLADGEITACPGEGEWLRRHVTLFTLPGPGVTVSEWYRIWVHARFPVSDPSHNI
jgi:hypothetical protein